LLGDIVGAVVGLLRLARDLPEPELLAGILLKVGSMRPRAQVSRRDCVIRWTRGE